MRHLKKFESFKINENENETHDIEKIVKQKIESLSPEEKEKLSSQLSELSVKLGLSPEEMTDTEKVAAALARYKGSLKIESLQINEGLNLKDLWNKIRTKFYSWLTYIGIGGVIASIATTAIGAQIQSQDIALADYVPDATIDPNKAIIIGSLAFVISTAAFIIGINKSKK